MLLSGCWLCLLYFCQVAGHAAWRREGLVGLSSGHRSLCYLVAGDPSARSLSFLARLGGPSGGLVLFQTTWSRQGELEHCTVREEETITRAYLAFCRKERDRPPGRFLTAPDRRLQAELRAVEERGLGCCSSPLTPSPHAGLRRARRSPPAGLAATLHIPIGAGFLRYPRPGARRRSRRGWTVPGTIWCGAGDSAHNFTDLGIFDQTDFCCREHDHCEHKLGAFEYNYGMRNFRLHTISHCDCDYSNCNVTELVPEAIVRPQSKYDYVEPVLDESQMELWSKPTRSPEATGRENQMATSYSVDNSLKTREDNSRSCKCYKPLDRCEYKISPQEFKFSYYNREPKTLYHCDCTKRLAKRMKKRVNVNAVEELLSEFVSMSCFRLKSVTRNCIKAERRLCEKQSSSTVAILSKPKHLQKILKVRRTVDESLYSLPREHKRNKNGTFIGTNSLKLYDKCLQRIRALTVKA
uniref:group 3 secretory phospholipase A2 isoform X2 n=1 Tax=Pristiophorus japonicus TaxID=55135 RepID=UPI00398EB83C